MKSLIALVLGLTLISFNNIEKLRPNRPSKWVIGENSSLIVNGHTNVNKFSCAIFQYPKTDTIIILQDQKNGLSLSGELNIEIKNFDCSNTIMTKELRKTLKESQFPTLQIRFISLKETSFLIRNDDFVNGLVAITIAGVTKRYEVKYFLNIEKNTMALTGRQPINFSDFKLETPKKMGKFIQTSDQLFVTFFLKMESVS